ANNSICLLGKRYKQYKSFQTRILVPTNSFELEMNIESVNVIFNNSMS
ncbi:unnamed protein product, partial [Rotaria sordida]